jgi:hypothetical protein
MIRKIVTAINNAEPGSKAVIEIPDRYDRAGLYLL